MPYDCLALPRLRRGGGGERRAGPGASGAGRDRARGSLFARRRTQLGVAPTRGGPGATSWSSLWFRWIEPTLPAPRGCPASEARGAGTQGLSFSTILPNHSYAFLHFDRVSIVAARQRQ